MENFENKLYEYAKLITEIGINVQKGSPLVINAPVSAADFARMLVKRAYELGASQVEMYWYDDFVTRQKFENAPVEVFEDFPKWIVERATFYGEKGAGVISLVSSDPELLSGIDTKKIEANNKARSLAMKPVYKYSMNDINSWCVVAIPSQAWAKKVFPDLDEDKRVEALWDAIFSAARVQGDAVANWKAHLADLKFRADFLNENKFDKLIYKSENGTNLEVGLPKGHIWISGASDNSHGVSFVANMPTEEVFTAPDANRINGELYSVRPLAYGGNLIDKFHLTFKDGKVVDYHAELGQEYLKDLLEVDEHAKMLGEVALVPTDSPISNSGILFYETLFDENASCHFAFGQAYPTCLEGGVDMTSEELLARGLNDSLIHEDFMVGAKDLSIVGVKEDGKEVQIFKDGNWAF